MSVEENKDAQKPTDGGLEQGTYEIIRERLLGHSKKLEERLEALNQSRKEVFGSVETKLLGTDRLTTEYNCTPRDMFPLGKHFLFGYNIHLGLKSTTEVGDVFSLYEFDEDHFTPAESNCLANERFQNDFRDLYRYYKNTQFVKFAHIGPFLYMVFRTGKNITDVKTFKWRIDEHQIEYIDNRSEHEYKFPDQHEFEWVRTHRDLHRGGQHPHISIEDRIFVETVGGDLTIKIEDNTEDGSGIYEEDVVNKDQTLDDAEIFYATVGSLILLKIRPYLEEKFRYIVYCDKTHSCSRIDTIEESCVLLPEDHGIIFSNGYFLQNGETKTFDSEVGSMMFERRIASPNGEDTIYLFYDRINGKYNLLTYNVIEQKVDIPIGCSGFSIFENGEMVLFRADIEPVKHHVVQFWQTPFGKEDFGGENQDHFLAKIGNKEVVRAMAECQEVLNMVQRGDSYENLYVDLVKKASDVIDAYFWLDKAEVGNLKESLAAVLESAKQAVDEFEKVRRLKKHTNAEVSRVEKEARTALNLATSSVFSSLKQYVDSLADLRRLRGEIISLKDLRYVDLEKVNGLEDSAAKALERLSNQTVEFLLQPGSLDEYSLAIQDSREGVENLTKVAEAKELEQGLDKSGVELEMLIEVVGNLKIEDSTQTTAIIEKVSEVFSDLNQVRILLKNKIRDLNSVEVVAEFNAQKRLLAQSVVNYLDLSDTVEKCEDYLSRLMVQLEELEGKVAEFDEFLEELSAKREEIYNAFETRKLQISEARQKKAESLQKSADRILKGIKNKVGGMKSTVEINGYFASDIMVDKVRSTIKELESLGDTTRSEGIASQLKQVRDEGVRQLKDKQELFADGENVIKLGKHKFGVSTGKLELTAILRDEDYFYHLTGTRFFEKMEEERFLSTRSVWSQSLVSENENVYRGEFLLWQFSRYLDTLEEEPEEEEELNKLLLDFMQKRFTEGYVKGQHDRDVVRMMKAFLPMKKELGLLSYAPNVRGLAMVWWEFILDPIERELLESRLRVLSEINTLFPSGTDKEEFVLEIAEALQPFLKKLKKESSLVSQMAAYLVDWKLSGLAAPVALEAEKLYRHIQDQLRHKRKLEDFAQMKESLTGHPFELLQLIQQYVDAAAKDKKGLLDHWKEEVVFWLWKGDLNIAHVVEISTQAKVEGLVGQHSRIKEGTWKLDFNEFTLRLSQFEEVNVPKYLAFEKLKKELIREKAESLRLKEFEPRVLGSFVRNQLIDKVYLPMIGDNFAKQIGTAGANKRTDLMGLLLLISPPGYGKTTLMEYVANRLGLVFMKINGPAIGHHVTSLDPSQAPDLGSAQEVTKLNLALEMGDNVMIYLDDIQHCNPEFLQKFISLCDGQRKIEGVWKGKSQTYDLRGRRVCVVMAGNPYTESGEKFQIPDMLANRADTYNLGDIIGGSSEAFELSYVENSLTSNSVLQSLARRNPEDVLPMVRLAQTGKKEGLEFQGNYSVEELNEITSVLKKLLRARDVVLKVNLQYIESAAQADEYRTEPPFKLQGSYRNMNKIAEKIQPIMNDDEFETLLLNHYENESQTLTSGAEANMLKLKDFLNKLSEAEAVRWSTIKETFAANNKVKSMGGDSTAALIGEVVRIQNQMANISGTLKEGVGKMGQVAQGASFSFSNLWEDSDEVYDWDKLRLEMGEWLKEEEFQQRLRLFTRQMKPLLKSVEPLYKRLETIQTKSLEKEEKEEITQLKDSINRILWVYGSFLKVLMAVKK